MPTDPSDTIVIVSAYQEADRLGSTLAALAHAFPGARVVVADDGSRDGTDQVALGAGVELVRTARTIGKGGAMTQAAERVMDAGARVYVLCDGDLGETARELTPLASAVAAGHCDLAIAVFARRVGGGFGAALGFSRWATRRLAGLELSAPISGQRALRGDVLRAVTPFAPRFGMETAMNVDAARAGFRVCEVELDLAHRATGRTLGGFVHRIRQLADFLLVYLDRRRTGRARAVSDGRRG
ncbi:MAG TPA: glycosyltransferase [Solirubrobacteraceae bacterium]|nr:glycosyltransferase [Solirubrobacteraceae bacterium]